MGCSLPVLCANQTGLSVFLPIAGYTTSMNSGSFQWTSLGVTLTMGPSDKCQKVFIFNEVTYGKGVGLPYCLCICATRLKY